MKRQSEKIRILTARAAFNLVELLVVIAIIAILAALLFPALGSAKLKSLQTKCRSNVKQLSMASFMYASENSQHAGYNNPAYPGGNWMGTLVEYAKDNTLRICPAAPLQSPPPSTGNGQGYVDRAWVRWTDNGRTMFYGSYGYNGWLYSDLKFKGKELWKQQLLFAKETAIEDPSRTPVFFDANWVDGWPLETDTPCVNLYEGRPYGAAGLDMGRCTIARHGGKSASSAPRYVPPGQQMPGAINVGMADGHAELVPLEKLWNCTWHFGWETPAVRPR